jgi:hypothetical protein
LMYQSLRDDDTVARGLVLGALTEDAVSPTLREKIKPLSRSFAGLR